MKCGHVSQGLDRDGNYACKLCYPRPDSLIIVKEMPSLEGRKAKCSDCGKIVESSYDLPFFKYRNGEKFDSYYCGCCGWN